MPFPKRPVMSISLSLKGTCARGALKIWHGLVHQVQSHLVQVLVPPEMAGSALGLLHILG